MLLPTQGKRLLGCLVIASSTALGLATSGRSQQPEAPPSPAAPSPAQPTPTQPTPTQPTPAQPTPTGAGSLFGTIGGSLPQVGPTGGGDRQSTSAQPSANALDNAGGTAALLRGSTDAGSL